ncbi:POP1-domain-containing protein [Fistulina hepatica ATCC 64428]|uniref:POP1-domain-containing protein n=1 Tax=Fistulina hepatica ATCC 64428 TaxID=1128425 RepID=A0A0D7A827_9AGAR|nr:POP1-domain-containing protein [Fistulina hepatica ATCC 64428]
MAPKRPAEPSQEISGRDRKKQKVEFARTITVQSVQGAGAGPSTVTIDSTCRQFQLRCMKGLPSQLDVERFAEARAFEIDAMHKAMKSASESSTQRVWQSLPRALRRRAASHDVRRVPVRLRERAKAEMDPVAKKPGHYKRKPGKTKRVDKATEFLKRQKNKKWLETHLWHAKRMHMGDLWGYRLALQPAEKSFRSSHRASVHGSILHDVSYQAVIELKGPPAILAELLRALTDYQDTDPGAKSRLMTGIRAFDTHLYEHNAYPYGLIAPVTVLWKAEDLAAIEQDRADRAAMKDLLAKQKGKRKAPASSTEPDEPSRTVWLRTHPAAYDKLVAEIKVVASGLLRDVGYEVGGPEIAIEIADLRNELVMFNIMGPKSSQVIKGTLKPARWNNNEFQEFWSMLGDLQSTASIPRNTVIGFTVNDPRLSFPPHNAKARAHKTTSQPQCFGSTALTKSGLWDTDVRQSLKTPRYKKKDLDRRREQHLIPGTDLDPMRQDDRIPVMLISRSLQGPGSQGVHGWTLMAPAGWGMAFLPSLIYTGTRVGGLRENAMQHFEAGVTYFPNDYPFTDPYTALWNSRAESDFARWYRTPPAKRVAYDKLGTRSPWQPDWGVVLGIESSPADAGDLVEVDINDAMDVDTNTIQPWLFRGQRTTELVEAMAASSDPAKCLLGKINGLRVGRKAPAFQDVDAEDLFQGALVRVQVLLQGRGNPDDMAIIYKMDDEEAKQWSASDSSQAADVVENDEEDEDHSEKQKDKIIGYVTSGNFSLARGHGFAIGAVPLRKFLILLEQSKRYMYILIPVSSFPSDKMSDRLQLSPPSSSSVVKPLVKIRDRNGQKFRGAYLQLID